MKSSIGRALMISAVILCLMLLSVLPRLAFYREIASQSDVLLDRETGLPYLEDMDCYYHLRMTRDLALYGHPGDTVKDGVPWDSFSYAPEGRDASGYKPLMGYLAIAVNRLISVFTSQSLEQTAYWLSPFLSVLVVIPVFLLTFEMSGMFGAIAASVLSALNLSYLYNTVPGFYDTDCVIIWLSCFFFYFGVKLVNGWQTENRKTVIVYGLAFFASFIALSQSWYVYYMFPVIFAGALLLFTLLTWKSDRGKRPFSFAPLLLSAGILGILLIPERNLFTNVRSIVGRIFSGEESGGLFPNVFSSINELQPPRLWDGTVSDLFCLNTFSETAGIISLSGGILSFLFAFICSVILIRRIIRKDVRFEYLLLLLWYGITLVLSFRGKRFIMLYSVPAAILAGNLTVTVCGRTDRQKRKFRSFCPRVIPVLLLIPALGGVCGVYRYICSVPAEDVWSHRTVEDCLLKIRENTPEDTVLATWWDYGYFLEDKGKRRTLFDGGSQTGQRTFFISRAFSTENEVLSANIFRMLSGSGDAGCSRMFSAFGETEETLLFMDDLLSGSKPDARKKLLNRDVSEAQADEITALLFPENPPLTECVITGDMPWISRWFPIFGRTMSEKAKESVRFAWEVNRMPIQLSESGRTVIDSGNGYYVILEKSERGWSARTSLSEEPSGEQPKRVERVICAGRDGCREYAQEQDLPKEISNPAENSALAQTPDPAEKSALTETPNRDKEAEPRWTVILSANGKETLFSMVSSDLADSVFGRLVYLGGEGLSRYKAEPDLSNEVLVYRILG